MRFSSLPSNLSLSFYSQSLFWPYNAASLRLFSSPSDINLEDDAVFYLSVYAGIGLVLILFQNLNQVLYKFGSYWASWKLHSALAQSVLYSPLRFFEVTPIGRILNRFSKDIENIDTEVMFSIMAFVFQIFKGVTIVAVVASVAPQIIFVIPVLSYIYFKIAEIYLLSSRELKRIESNNRSPLYSQFSETLTGISTLRAYGSEERFEKMNQLKIDNNHKPFHFIWVANRWLCVRLEFISVGVVFLAGFGVIFSGISPGMAALVLTLSLIHI